MVSKEHDMGALTKIEDEVLVKEEVSVGTDQEEEVEEDMTTLGTSTSLTEMTKPFTETELQEVMLETEVKAEEGSEAKIGIEANPAKQGTSKGEMFLGNFHQEED